MNQNLLNAITLITQTAGHEFPDLRQLRAISPSNGYVIRAKTATTGYSLLMLDVTLGIDGNIWLIEANGSNAALSSAMNGAEDARLEHMVAAYDARAGSEIEGAVLFAHQPNFLHIPEFFLRAYAMRDELARSRPCEFVGTHQSLAPSGISIVSGAIPDIAEGIRRCGNQLYYENKPILFAVNPNLLPELARRNIISYTSTGSDADILFFHEGLCTPLVHDKLTQQNIADGTGITAMACAEAHNLDECIGAIAQLHQQGWTAVAKMNAGSGGSGIEFFPPNLTYRDILARLSKIESVAIEKYGADVGRTLYPIRLFQFVKSTPYLMADGDHLWDLRVQCTVFPGYVDVRPLVLRLCPSPFNPKTFDRDGVVSNLTGRKASLDFMRSPFAMHEILSLPVLESVGIDQTKLGQMLNACARWCESAWAFSHSHARGYAPRQIIS